MKLKRYFPLLSWGPHYGRQNLGRDLLAAVIVTTVLIPQALAYAVLAGLPPEVGLYASIVPLLAYAVFGTSSTLAVGPVAIIALMTASAAGSVAAQGSAEYLGAALVLAMLSGLILVGMGIARLGFLANFLSHPVISGFMTSAALIIAASQLGALAGVEAQGQTLAEILPSLAANLNTVNFATLLVGLGSLMFLFAARRGLRSLLVRIGIPERGAVLLTRGAPIVVVALSTFAVWGMNLEQRGVQVVGDIPPGLPPLTFPPLQMELWSELLMSAVLISVVTFVSSISVAQTLGARQRERVDPNQELLGLGSGNIAASITGAMPVGGAFARSVVNLDAGARTPAAGAFTGTAILIAALVITPLISHLPMATLAAIIIASVLSLVDVPAIRRTWRYSRSDFAAMMATLVLTLTLGVEIGISVGVGLSLALHLYATSRPHSAIIGRVPGSEHFRNVSRHEVETDERLIILRVDESLYFANARYLEDRVLELARNNPDLQHIVLACQGVNVIDASAVDTLLAINEQLQDTGVMLHLAEVKGPVMDRLKKTDLYQALTGRIFLSTFHAWEALHSTARGD